MPRSLPDRGVHNDCGILTDHIIAVTDRSPPPVLFNVALHFTAQGAVIPEAVDAAIDFGTVKYETAALA